MTLRVGIVNDMRLAVEALRRVVESGPDLEVAWTAYNGSDAVAKCGEDRPDVVLMDLIMPGINGAETTRRIMRETPCAILVVTASVGQNAGLVFDAMGAGAVDAVATPTLGADGRVEGGEELLKKLRTVSKIIGKPLTSTPNGSPGAGESLPPLAAIGASTGGPKALAEVLRHLPLDFLGAVIVVQHVDEGFTAGLADWLDSQTILPVRRAKEEDRPSAGRILIAGGEKHLILGPRLTLTYSAEPSELPYRPSVDQLFLSLARHWPRPGVAALLTGMGKDGAQGLLALRRAGWLTVAQDEATSMVYGMPKAAAETGAAKHVLPPNEIATKMIHFCNHNHHSNGSKPEQATGERS